MQYIIKNLAVLAAVAQLAVISTPFVVAEELPDAAPIPEHEEVVPATELSEGRKAALKQWNTAKFGLFLHWGVYSVYGGTYNGKELWAAEWIQENARIPYDEYAKTAAAWNPTDFDADAWVRSAKNAGMGYIVITARHHDGFALYPSKASKYNLMEFGPYKGPDPLAALKAACKKHGLLFGIYYSPLEFRSSPKGFNKEDEKAVAEGFDYRTMGPKPYATNAEVVALAQAQLKELAETYKPDIFWLDGTWYKMGQWTPEDAQAAAKTIRNIVPNVMINNRLGADADFLTVESKIPAKRPVVTWEYCWNLGAFWGYNPRNYTPKILKTPEHYIETLVNVSSLGGNYLLNVGPDPTGKIHPMAVDYLTQIGVWVKANAEAVHGVSGSPFQTKPTWGYVTSREGKVYLIVKDWPAGKPVLTLPLLKNKVTGARLLSTPGKTIPVVAGAQEYTIGPVVLDPAKPFTVIELSVVGVPQALLEAEPVVAPSAH